MPAASLDDNFRRVAAAAIERSASQVALWLSDTDPRVSLLNLLCVSDHQIWRDYEGHDISKRVLRNFRWGMNEALFATQIHQKQAAEPLLFETNASKREFLSQVLQAAGQVRIGRHYLAAHEQGLVKVETFRNGKCVLAPAVADTLSEVAEYLDLLWVTEASMELSGTNKLICEKKSKLPKLREKMRKSVSLVDGRFIQYSIDPEVHSFFVELAELEVQRAWGWDEFPRDVKFGGIEFGCYCDWAFYLAKSMLMHAQFVLALCEYESAASLIELMPAVLTEAQNVKQAQSVTDLSESEAAQVVRTLAMGPWNWTECLSMARGPTAPQYMLTDDILIRSFAGCTVNPVDFMMHELERNHSSDWSGNVNSRESVFRGQIACLLRSHDGIKALPKNVWITSPLGKTDIDLVILDERSGTLGLFQLKWQRIMNADMRARRTQGGNLANDAKLWIDRTISWTSGGAMKSVLESSGLGKKSCAKITSICVFIVGRHFSRISGDGGDPDPRAAWGNWWQIRRLVLENRIDPNDPITSLYKELISETPLDRVPVDQLAKQEARLKGLTIRLKLY